MMTRRFAAGMTVLKAVMAAGALIGTAPAVSAQPQFPYDQVMLLEIEPMPGQRRMPMMEILTGGRASVDLWCHAATADVAVTGDQIKFTFLSAQPEGCTPERAELDQAIGKALSEVTHWRRQDDIVTLTGPTTFRFRLSTN